MALIGSNEITTERLELRPLIYDLDYNALEETVARWGEPGYRVHQIWQGLYRHLWERADQFTNLPRVLRDRLEKEFNFRALTPQQVQESTDGETRKTLFTLGHGLAIETVLMHYNRRRTLCISSQAGCAMGCVFCATGQMGFRRNLSSGEIVEQVLYYARQLGDMEENVTNVVLMGMGEPFHNYDQTLAAIDRLNHPLGMNMGARRFTISTVGLVPAIRRFASEGRQVNLAISLHAADDETRSALLPINRKYPLADLLTACREYVDATGRRVSFEWALIRDVNDTPEQATQLAQRLQIFRKGAATLCHVNIIPLNPTKRYRGKATTRERADAFRTILEAQGISCTIRMRRGIDIQAGCGQLATQNQAIENEAPARQAASERKGRSERTLSNERAAHPASTAPTSGKGSERGRKNIPTRSKTPSGVPAPLRPGGGPGKAAPAQPARPRPAPVKPAVPPAQTPRRPKPE